MNNPVAVIIGRWQILQKGHIALLRAALAAAPRVIVVIGSAWRARDPHKPFTWAERQQQLEAVLSPEERPRVSFLPVRDYFDDRRWNAAVTLGVRALAGEEADIVLVGHRKDHTSYYLNNFPRWRQQLLASRPAQASPGRPSHHPWSHLRSPARGRPGRSCPTGHPRAAPARPRPSRASQTAASPALRPENPGTGPGASS